MDSLLSEKPELTSASPPLEIVSSSSVKDIVYGSVAGGCGKLFEYPFDTIKVRLQSQPETQPLLYKGPIDCFRKSVNAEGVKGLYRGVAAPVFGAAAETASLFVTFNWTRKAIGEQTGGHWNALICGSISGAITSFVLTPIELVKCMMQVQGSLGLERRGFVGVCSQILRENGIAGFWRGQTGTLLRESGGSAAWFGANDYVTKMITAGQRDKTAVESMIAGAAAGISYNLSLFPADTIKSRVQTDPDAARRGFIGTGRMIVRNGGIRALYRGCGVTVCRSAPSSGIIFLTYDTLMKLF